MPFNLYIEGVRHRPDVDLKVFKQNVKETSAIAKTQKIGTHPNPEHIESAKQAKMNYYQEQSSRELLLAKHIMSAGVFTLHASDPLQTAWDIFHQFHFRHIPLVIQQHKVYGIISDRDILKLISKNRSAIDRILNQPIKNHCKKNVLTATADTPVTQIAKILFDARIGSIPVVSESQEILGIITRSDILRVMIHHPDFSKWV